MVHLLWLNLTRRFNQRNAIRLPPAAVCLLVQIQDKHDHDIQQSTVDSLRLKIRLAVSRKATKWCCSEHIKIRTRQFS